MKAQPFKYQRPFYLSNGFIILLATLWPLLGLPLVGSLILSRRQKAFDQIQMNTYAQACESQIQDHCEAKILEAKRDAAEIIKQAERVMIDISEVNSALITRKYSLQDECQHLEAKIEILSLQLPQDPDAHMNQYAN